MTPEARQRLKGLILKHEGCKNFPYTDTTGNLSIGVGRCLTTRGISTNEALTLLDDDILYFSSRLSQLCPYFDSLDDNRKIALIDMAFNLGINGFLGFHDMHTALEKGDYNAAYNAILDSKWKDQVGKRAIVDAYIIKTGEI